ncbi:MAG: hypothetical protein ABFD81_14465 [Syntrophaceae bacterium]
MKGTIKDLLNITGVQGYIIASGKNLQIKVPSRPNLSGIKERLMELYRELIEEDKRPGNTIEIYMDDAIITIFLSGTVMLMVVSHRTTNMALLRMTGKLVAANIMKER